MYFYHLFTIIIYFLFFLNRTGDAGIHEASDIRWCHKGASIRLPTSPLLVGKATRQHCRLRAEGKKWVGGVFVLEYSLWLIIFIVGLVVFLCWNWLVISIRFINCCLTIRNVICLVDNFFMDRKFFLI